MRLQLVGFIKETIPGSNNPKITGIKIVDLDRILDFTAKHPTLLCPDRLKVPMNLKNLSKLGSDIFYGEIQIGVDTKEPLVMDATVESVVIQLKSGLRIAGLTFNQDKVKGSLEEGLEGSMAPLQYYPFSLDGEVKNNNSLVLLDFRKQFLNNNRDILAGLVLSFDSKLDFIIYSHSNDFCTLYSGESNINLANAIISTRRAYQAVTFVSRNEVLESYKLTENEGWNPSIALHEVIRKNEKNILGFHGANLSDFLYSLNRYAATSVDGKSVCSIHLLGKKIFLGDIEIEELYLPEAELELVIEPCHRENLNGEIVLDSSNIFALKKLVGAENFELLITSKSPSNDFWIFLSKLEEVRLFNTITIHEFLNYPILVSGISEYSVPKLILNSSPDTIINSFNNINVYNYCDGVMDLRDADIRVIDNAFNGIVGIKKVILPRKLEKLESSFNKLIDLEEIDFSYCTKLQRIHEIAECCSSLKRVILASSLARIEESFNLCTELTDVIGLDTINLIDMVHSFHGVSIKEVIIRCTNRWRIVNSFLECSVTKVELSGNTFTNSYGDSLGGRVVHSFCSCDQITSIKISGVASISKSFDKLPNLTYFPLIKGEVTIDDSFNEMELNYLILTDNMTDIFRNFKHCKLHTVDIHTTSNNIHNANFVDAEIERLNMYTKTSSSLTGSILKNIRFLDFKNGCSFSHFEEILSKYNEYLILPDSVTTIVYPNLAEGKYLKAIYIPPLVTFKHQSSGKNLGEMEPDGALILIHKDSKAIKFIQRRKMRYQIVESQDEAREIMEGMYKKNLEEQGKLSRQVQKLQMVGVEGELLEPKFAGSYSKLKQIEAGLTKTLEQKDLIPISEEVAKVAIERKYFPYLVDGSDNGVRVRKFSQAITDTPLTTEKSQRFRALLNLFVHLGIRSDAMYNLGRDNPKSPLIDFVSFFKFNLPTGEVINPSQRLVISIGSTESRVGKLREILVNYSRIRSAIFIEDNKVLWVAPILEWDSLTLSGKETEYESISKLLQPNDIIASFLSGSSKVSSLEIPKELGGKIYSRFIEEYRTIQIGYKGASEGNLTLYSLFDGSVVIVNVELLRGEMKYFIESSGERYLQKPDYSQIKAFRIKEVYRSLDEFKLKNPEEYAKTKEFLAPEKYLKVYEEHFRNIIYPDRLITAQDYDPVEPCYEYTLGQYLVNCGIKTVDLLNANLMSNILASSLFYPKRVRKKTLDDKFIYESITLCDGKILTQFEHIEASTYNSGIKIDGLPMKAHYYIVVTDSAKDLDGKTLDGYFSCLPFIPGRLSKDKPLFKTLLELGTSSIGAKAEYITKESYNIDDFITCYALGFAHNIFKWIIMVNKATGVPFIGIIGTRGAIKTVFRLKSLEISYKNLNSLFSDIYGAQEAIYNYFFFNEERYLPAIAFIHNLILMGATHGDLDNIKADYSDIIATQPKLNSEE